MFCRCPTDLNEKIIEYNYVLDKIMIRLNNTSMKVKVNKYSKIYFFIFKKITTTTTTLLNFALN